MENSKPESVLEAESSDVTRVLLEDGREIIVIGTAHISQKSVDIVKQTIAAEEPDVVAIELDEGRYEAIKNPDAWQNLNLREVMKKGQTTFLIARLALMSFQKRMASHTGVRPGAEMIAAIDATQASDIQLELIDRDIQVTLRRAWRMTPWWRRSMMATMLVGGVFQKTEVDEDELEKLRESHNIAELLEEMGEGMPELKRVILDERDSYMAAKIRKIEGQKIVVVIGAAHKAGMVKKLEENEQVDLDILMHVPEKEKWTKIIPWIFPLAIIGVFVFAYFNGNYEEMKTAALAWVLMNGTLAALGCIIALAHPLTIIAGFIAAPITSLVPVIGVGMVTGPIQATFSTPTVRDMENAGDDFSFKGVWTNKFLRVLLVFVLSTLGSLIGSLASLGFLKDLILPIFEQLSILITSLL